MLDQEWVVGPAHHRRARLAREAEQQARHGERVGLVEAGGRLVGEEEPGSACHRAGDGDPLALPAGEVGDPPPRGARQADGRERLGGSRARLVGLDAAQRRGRARCSPPR